MKNNNKFIYKNRTIKELILTRNEKQELRKVYWQEHEKIQEEKRNCKNNLEKYKHLLNISLPRYITIGLATVEKIVDEFNISKDIFNEEESRNGLYLGPIIDNITLKHDGFRIPVEVAAGNSLFYVIVDSDKTAAFLMKELERRKSGRLTFLPLNQLRVPEVIYPNSNDVRSLINVALNYNQRIHPAILQVFHSIYIYSIYLFNLFIYFIGFFKEVTCKRFRNWFKV